MIYYTDTHNGKSYTFTYNDEGMRTSKTVYGVKTVYYLNGTQILAEETQGNLTVYLYDAYGAPIGLQYRSKDYAAGVWDTYWYEKNLQGDIVAVYDEMGVKLVSYVYDAYGNATVTYHNGGVSTTVVNNPFRYRGYYYDIDLGMYYLQTRYYDPVIGRFISPDSYASTGTGILGCNMYAYCENNPVMYVDPTGEFPWLIIAGIALGVAVITIGAKHIQNNHQNIAENEAEINDILNNMNVDFTDQTILIDEMNKILQTYDGDSEQVRASIRDTGLYIANSYRVKDPYTRQMISMMYVRSGLTTCRYTNLSAEWLGHNIVHPFMSESTFSVDLEFLGDKRWWVYIPAWILAWGGAI